jgi:hypothetical protein
VKSQFFKPAAGGDPRRFCVTENSSVAMRRQKAGTVLRVMARILRDLDAYVCIRQQLA